MAAHPNAQAWLNKSLRWYQCKQAAADLSDRVKKERHKKILQKVLPHNVLGCRSKRKSTRKERQENIEKKAEGYDLNAFYDYLKKHEGERLGLHGQQGDPTIGVGHSLRDSSRPIFNQLFGDQVDFDRVRAGQQKLTPEQSRRLFEYDTQRHLRRAEQKIPSFADLNPIRQKAILSGFYRGDIGPKTIEHINNGDWEQAATEYLNHQGYRTAPKRNMSGIVTRMDENSRLMRQGAVEPPAAPQVSPVSPASPQAPATPQAPTRTYTVQKGDTLSGIAKNFYGNPNYQAIVDANSGINDPNKIAAGQTVTIPSKSPSTPKTPETAETSETTEKSSSFSELKMSKQAAMSDTGRGALLGGLGAGGLAAILGDGDLEDRLKRMLSYGGLGAGLGAATGRLMEKYRQSQGGEPDTNTQEEEQQPKYTSADEVDWNSLSPDEVNQVLISLPEEERVKAFEGIDPSSAAMQFAVYGKDKLQENGLVNEEGYADPRLVASSRALMGDIKESFGLDRDYARLPDNMLRQFVSPSEFLYIKGLENISQGSKAFPQPVVAKPFNYDDPQIPMKDFDAIDTATTYAPLANKGLNKLRSILGVQGYDHTYNTQLRRQINAVREPGWDATASLAGMMLDPGDPLTYIPALKGTRAAQAAGKAGKKLLPKIGPATTRAGKLARGTGKAGTSFGTALAADQAYQLAAPGLYGEAKGSPVLSTSDIYTRVFPNIYGEVGGDLWRPNANNNELLEEYEKMYQQAGEKTPTPYDFWKQSR